MMKMIGTWFKMIGTWFKMIGTWFKMKAMEIRLKAMLYSAALKVIEEKEDIIEVAGKMYVAFKDATSEEIRKELIKEIAHLAHEQAAKERENQDK